MNINLKDPNMYSSSPNTCGPTGVSKPHRCTRAEMTKDAGEGVPTRTGNMLNITARTKKTEIHTALSTLSPTAQFKRVFPSS